MKTPLTRYNELAKEYKLTETKAFPTVAQLSFARTQQQEAHMVVNRLLVDVAKAEENLEGAKDEPTREAYAELVSKYRKDLRQIAENYDFFSKLVEELEPLVKALEA